MWEVFSTMSWNMMLSFWQQFEINASLNELNQYNQFELSINEIIHMHQRKIKQKKATNKYTSQTFW